MGVEENEAFNRQAWLRVKERKGRIMNDCRINTSNRDINFTPFSYQKTRKNKVLEEIYNQKPIVDFNPFA